MWRSQSSRVFLGSVCLAFFWCACSGAVSDGGNNISQRIQRGESFLTNLFDTRLRGCWGSEAGHFLRALRILERHAAHVPWRFIGARTYQLGELHEALQYAEAMRIPKALVRPNA